MPSVRHPSGRQCRPASLVMSGYPYHRYGNNRITMQCSSRIAFTLITEVPIFNGHHPLTPPTRKPSKSNSIGKVSVIWRSDNGPAVTSPQMTYPAASLYTSLRSFMCWQVRWNLESCGLLFPNGKRYHHFVVIPFSICEEQTMTCEKCAKL